MPLLTQTNELELINSNALGESQRTLQVSEPMMSGPDVRALQTKLMNLGYSLPQYGADGVYGSETETAVVKFQKKNNLPPTGIVGPDTWAALGKGKSGLPQVVNQTKEKIKQRWMGLTPTEQWMYGIGGTALVLGVGMAIRNASN